MVGAVAAVEEVVLREEVAGIKVRLAFQRPPERHEAVEVEGRPGLGAVEDEVGLLEVVDAVARAHDAGQIEADPVGRGALQREHRLGGRGGDAGADDA